MRAVLIPYALCPTRPPLASERNSIELMHLRTIALPLILAGMALLQNEGLSHADEPKMKPSPITFAQPGCPTCDLDVLFGGKPAFRLLVPEHLAAHSADGPLNVPRFIHLLKGRWTTPRDQAVG